MTAVRYYHEASRSYDAPRALVWAIVSDTNRSDRALGLAAATYRWEQDEKSGMVRIATAKELGLELQWIEPPYEWIEGRFLEGRRVFIKGPVAFGGFSARLEDEPDGRTKLVAVAWVEVEGIGRLVIGPMQRGKFKRALARYLDGIENVLAGWRELDLGSDDEPAAARIARLTSSTLEPTTTGHTTPADELVLTQRAARLKESGAAGEVVDRLVKHLRERPDDEVSQMRPFELARLWGLDRREVLRAFLYGTIAGLTDLRWQINCPICRVGASVVADLSAIEETSHCAACQIHYDTDFAQHVEAIFPCNEAVRSVTTALYCASSPAFLPHVFAQVRAVPGEPCEHAIDLPSGPVHLRVLGRRGGADLEVSARSTQRLRVQVGADSLTAVLEPAESSALQIVNDTAEPVVVLLERAGWAADTVLGSVISSLPEFHDLFATEAPARGVELRVGHLALLFSDLIGSTALYQRVGDARAFAIVEEHFRVAGKVIAEADGAIVKTMGDAVMASFPSLREAVAAAKAMIAASEGAESEHGLGVKVGVHAGPCLAVRANERLDFFGTTVNLAARLQAKAGTGELVLLRECAEDPAVRALLEGLPTRGFVAALKGIQSEQDLVAIDVRAPSAELPLPLAGGRASNDLSNRSA